MSDSSQPMDVPLVMNGEVAMLTLEGYLETASCLAAIVIYLDRGERDGKGVNSVVMPFDRISRGQPDR